MSGSTPLRQLHFTAIDFESAGSAKGRTDSPVQIGLASWSIESGHHSPFHSYLRTDQPITWSARKVHGIRDEDLVDAPNLPELWPQIKQRLSGHIVIAHGMGTEKRFLRAFPGHRFGPWVDTLLVARAAYPQLPSHSLSDLCDALQISEAVATMQPDRKWHDALFDAVASLAVLEKIVSDHELSDRGLDLLIHPDISHWSSLRRR